MKNKQRNEETLDNGKNKRQKTVGDIEFIKL